MQFGQTPRCLCVWYITCMIYIDIRYICTHAYVIYITYIHCNTLLQHTAATHYCNTLLQHAAATHYCNTLLQHTTGTHMTHSHTTATLYCYIIFDLVCTNKSTLYRYNIYMHTCMCNIYNIHTLQHTTATLYCYVSFWFGLYQ